MTQAESNVLVKLLVAKANEKKGTLQNFVVQAGIPVPTYRAWLKSESVPTEEEIKKLCDTLECSVDEIKKAAKISSGKPEKTSKESREPKEDFMPKPEEPTTNTEEKKESHSDKESAPKEPKKSSPKKTKTPQTETPVKESVTPEPVAEPETAQLSNKEVPAKKERKPRTPKVPKEPVQEETLPLTPVEKFYTQVNAIERMMEEAQTTFLNLVKTTGENPPVESRYLELLETAKNASDDGIALAITILQKFPLA